jgi:thioredoxin 1
MKVLYFTAAWCGPCRAFKGTWDKVSGSYPGIEFVKVDVDDQPELATANTVRAVPTLVFTGDKLRTTRQGSMSEATFREWLDSCVRDAK